MKLLAVNAALIGTGMVIGSCTVGLQMDYSGLGDSPVGRLIAEQDSEGGPTERQIRNIIDQNLPASTWSAEDLRKSAEAAGMLCRMHRTKLECRYNGVVKSKITEAVAGLVTRVESGRDAEYSVVLVLADRSAYEVALFVNGYKIKGIDV